MFALGKLKSVVIKAIAMAVVGLIVCGLSGSAYAAAGSKTYVNVSTGFCLDSNAQGNVYTLPCNGGNYQQWTQSGNRRINVSTGFCLDSNAQGNVYTLPCNGGNYQNWGRYGNRRINMETGLCLDSNAQGNVYTLRCNGGNYQNWQ